MSREFKCSLVVLAILGMGALALWHKSCSVAPDPDLDLTSWGSTTPRRYAFSSLLLADTNNLLSIADWTSEVVSLDITARRIRWRAPVGRREDFYWIRSGAGNRIVATGLFLGEVVVFDATTGHTVQRCPIEGWVFAAGADNRAFCTTHRMVGASRFSCFSLDTETELWSFDPDSAECQIDQTLCGDHVLITLNPAGHTTRDRRLVAVRGRYEVICLSSADGQVLWRRELPVPLQSTVSTRDLHLFVVADPDCDLVLLVRDKEIFAVAGDTGEEVAKNTFDFTFKRGGVLWRDDLFVLETDGHGLAVVDARTMAVVKRLDPPVSCLDAKVQDGILLSGFQRVDLESGQIAGAGPDLVRSWRVSMHDIREERDLTYFGGAQSGIDGPRPFRVLGVWRTGAEKLDVLYAEPNFD